MKELSVNEEWDKFCREQKLNKCPPATLEVIELAFRTAHERGYIAGMKMQRKWTRLQLGLEEKE